MATILDLLMALNRGDLPPLPAPAPSAPIPYAPTGLEPLRDDTSAAFGAQNPEPVPPAIVQPAGPDQNFVNTYAGAAPTPPAPLSRGQRIANALIGFGAGVQGQGAQFLSQLQEPQREYQRQRGQYEENRRRGIEIDQRRAENDADRANRAAELQYNREYQTWLKKYGVREGAAAKQAENAFELLKEARRSAEAERKERALFKRQTYLQIDDRIKAYRDQGADKYAEELARSDFRMALGELGEKVPPLSAAASKANKLVQAKVQRALRLAQGGGAGGGTGPVMAQLANGQVVPLSVVDKQNGEATINGVTVPVVGYVGGRIPAQPRQAEPTAGAPDSPLQGPYVPPSYFEKPKPTQGPSDAEVKAYAKRFKISPTKARKELMGQ